MQLLLLGEGPEADACEEVLRAALPRLVCARSAGEHEGLRLALGGTATQAALRMGGEPRAGETYLPEGRYDLLPGEVAQLCGMTLPQLRRGRARLAPSSLAEFVRKGGSERAFVGLFASRLGAELPRATIAIYLYGREGAELFAAGGEPRPQLPWLWSPDAVEDGWTERPLRLGDEPFGVLVVLGASAASSAWAARLEEAAEELSGHLAHRFARAAQQQQEQHAALQERLSRAVGQSESLQGTLPGLLSEISEVLGGAGVACTTLDPSGNLSVSVAVGELGLRQGDVIDSVAGWEDLFSLPVYRTLAVEDLRQAPLSETCIAQFGALGVRAVLWVPLGGQGSLPWYLVLTSPGPRRWGLREQQTAVHAATCIALAIQSEQRRVEFERTSVSLMRVAEEWQLTFDVLDTAIIVLDPRRHIVRINQAGISLAGRSEPLLSGTSLDVLGEDPLWAAIAARHEAARHGDISEHTISLPDGRTFALSAVPFSGVNRSEDLIVLLARDLTRLTGLQISLQRSQRMASLGELVAGVAHEVRNPLFGISATLDALEVRYSAREELAPYLKVLRGEIARLRRLMQELLDYGRPYTPQLGTNQLQPLLSDALFACTALAERSQVSLRLECPPFLWVRVDRNRIAQVFQNLIENAIQHSPRGAEVRVEVFWGPSQIECRVVDSGVGFPEEEIEQLFEPFFSKRRGGTGLGLSIARRFVEDCDGRIWAQNRPEGGASFSVVLTRTAPWRSAQKEPSSLPLVPAETAEPPVA